MRKRLLLSILAVALLAPVAAADGSGPSEASRQLLPPAALPASGEPAELRVHSGWACVLVGEARDWLTPLDGLRRLAEGFYLELGTSSEVELSWSGSASIRLRGPAGLFVEPAAQPFGGRAIGFRRVGSADFEVRRGALTISLPRAQRLLPAAGAFRLEGHPGGLVELWHHAGAPIELDIGARYTFPLRPGTRRRLPECIAAPLLLPAPIQKAPTPAWTAATIDPPRPYRGSVEIASDRPRR